MMTPNPDALPAILDGVKGKRHAAVEAKQASLSTLSVTIQALHVSGKQMTLSVFRQLPVDDVYCFPSRHTLWGTVRYPLKHDGELVDEWVVAECYGTLFRGEAYRPVPKWAKNDPELVKHWGEINEATCYLPQLFIAT
jgi:hypothetical protein